MAPAVVAVDTLPKFISPDEHKTLVASTPASFSDIPPVLRHKEDNVSITLDPALPEFSAQELANGTLYVIESVLIFMSAAGRGLQVEYPSITLHAISRSETGPSIYCQLDESPKTDAAPQDDEEIAEMREMIIIPKAAESLEPIFEALSLCASLHPDPADPNDMDDDDAFIDADGPFETFTGADGEELSEVGRAALAHLESIIYDPFAPKEEDDQHHEVEQPDSESHGATTKEQSKDTNGA